MARLMDMGLERLRNMLYDMAKLSEETVSTAIEAYTEGKDLMHQIFENSEKLRIIQDEISDLSVELLARFQPFATDLRQIKSYMEISYGFSRFGRYAYDISQVLGVFGDLSMCDKTVVRQAGDQAIAMIKLSIKTFMEKDIKIAKTLRKMDTVVDSIYLNHVQTIARTPGSNLNCSVSATLILRYLERIADHATYIGDSVRYIETGERAARK